ncbi:MAG: hypothetical protein M3512_11905 [Bacteroidota bacterium]|nr:hypothetical protein [Bacteroidota bacterium]
MKITEIIFEVFGWIGAGLFLISYFYLVNGKWSSDANKYHLFNIFGGVLLVLNTAYYEVWAAVFINAAWAAIAIFGLLKKKSKKSQDFRLLKV